MTARNAPIRVMIVEDSAVVRHLLTHIVSRDPRLAVAAAVESGEEALAAIDRIAPDVISMDIRLPGIDGLETIARIMSQRPTPIVVVADAVEDASLRISLNALREGALAVVEKPVAVSNASYEAVANTICTQLAIMAEVPVIRRRNRGLRAGEPVVPPGVDSATFAHRPQVVAIAASTGGPPAVARVLKALPADCPVPVLVVQHMGAAFMEGFAGWLDGQSDLRVSLARGETVAEAGRVYVAPGDRHLSLLPGLVLAISDDPPLGGQRPSASRLFASLARAVGPRAVGVLLTGMGEDGASGLVAMREAGAYTITEDVSTAVVYGMPAAAVRLGGSRVSLPLDLIGPRVLKLVQGGR